ncbi:hypothetical protein IMG5_074370 [Ichthyophthirius multifiliis]|uniref:Uncharacterized protein n=1 Tax=Ichthyophthirius multifiliis TaxID=5932 RepID=G0QQ23_ICHMU|nr:hypothetical protein IMG5_074370 [Ichthyophthirius multifiliis]EGR32683.1 hypothetical protein IMG5_074370 [Ichthyophthirius multifiliis]|eukprot:XP_004036669.1 hypothetical protein IMG5_074370 [Ichthyophthirius multifiliis]
MQSLSDIDISPLNSDRRYIRKTVTVIPTYVDTNAVVNPKSRKGWRESTNQLQDLFTAKDEEIEYWKKQCEQQVYTVTEQLQIVNDNVIQYKDEIEQYKLDNLQKNEMFR